MGGWGEEESRLPRFPVLHRSPLSTSDAEARSRAELGSGERLFPGCPPFRQCGFSALVLAPQPHPRCRDRGQGKPGDRRGQVPRRFPRRAAFRALRPSGSADFQLLPLHPGLSPAPGQEGEGNWAIGGSKFPLVPPPGGFPSSPLREVCGSHAPLPRQGWRAKGVGGGRQDEGPSRPRPPSSSADFQRPYPKFSLQCRNGGEDRTGWQAVERATFQPFRPSPFPQHWDGKPSGAFARAESRAGRAPRQRQPEKPARLPGKLPHRHLFSEEGKKRASRPGPNGWGAFGRGQHCRRPPPHSPAKRPLPIDRVVSAGYDGGREGGSPCQSGKSRWATGRTTPSAKA